MIIPTRKLFVFVLVVFTTIAIKSQVPGAGLTKTETPVPFGKLTYVTGFGWQDRNPDLRFIRIPDDTITFPGNVDYAAFLDQKGKKVLVHQIAENTLTIQLPDEEFGVAMLFLDKARNEKSSLLINKARLDWLSTNNANRGDTLRAFGRSLIGINLYPERNDEGKPVSHAGYVNGGTKVAIQDGDGKYHWCEIIKSSSYDIHFILPETCSAGESKIFVHNGYGGKFGWSEPQALNIEKTSTWPKKVFNVMDYGAIGDSYADDSESITKALGAARKNGGGIVYFPRGGYHFNTTLRVPDKTVLRGESRKNTWLYLPDGFHTNARDTSVKLAIAGEGSIGVENLSIHAVYVNMVIAAPVGKKLPETYADFVWKASDKTLMMRSNNSYVRNCRILHNFTHLYHRRFGDPAFEKEFNYLKEEMSSHGKAVNVALRGDNVIVDGNEFQGKGSNVCLADCRYSRISNNIMHAGHQSNGIAIKHGKTGYEKIIIEGNTLDGIATTHHSAFYMMHGGRNMFIANNKIVRQFWVSDNEGILGHMWGYRFPLYIKKSEGKKLFIDQERMIAYWDSAVKVVSNWLSPFYTNDNKMDLQLFIGKEIQVFRGQGLGQFNTIDKIEGNVAYLKEDFKTAVNSKSVIAVHEVTAYRNLVIADNEMEDCGQAVFFWGHSHDIIIDGNSATRAGRIGAWAVVYSGNIAGGCHFFQIINNQADEGRSRVVNHHKPGGRYMGGGIGNHYSCPSPYPTSSGGALNYVGYIIRNNLLENDCIFNFSGYNDDYCQEEHFDLTDQKKDMPHDHIGFIFEDNESRSCKYGIAIGTSVKAVIRNNLFEDVENEIYKMGDPAIVEVNDNK